MFGRGRRSRGRPRVKAGPVLGSLLVACIAVLAAAPADSLAKRKPAATRPNVIQIVLDDATWQMLGHETTPEIWRHLARRGATFPEAITTSPLCCPSRAAMMTGQYAHNNGIWRQEPGYAELIEPGNVLEVWMQRAGYKTIFVGKVISAMIDNFPFSGVPPGWDEWYATQSHRFYETLWSLNGRRRKFGPADRNHLTRMINRRAQGATKRALKRDRPFYLSISHLAPHRSKVLGEGPEICQGGHAGPVGRLNVPFDNVSPPLGPAFNEFDTSDKPPMIEAWPEINAERKQEIVESFRCAVASLAEVDRGIGKLIKTLQRRRALGRTAIILMSDNGYSWGEHRLVHTKHFAYDENVRVPFLIRLPQKLKPRPARVRSVARVALLDAVPTILELAQTKSCVAKGRCRPLDGRSLVRAARGKVEPWHEERAIGIELGRGDWAGYRWPCRYSAVRTPAGTYIDHSELPDASGRCVPDSFIEIYDAAADPFQLDNLAADPYADGALQSELAAVHARISTCLGIEGRERHPGPGRSFCD